MWSTWSLQRTVKVMSLQRTVKVIVLSTERYHLTVAINMSSCRWIEYIKDGRSGNRVVPIQQCGVFLLNY